MTALGLWCLGEKRAEQGWSTSVLQSAVCRAVVLGASASHVTLIPDKFPMEAELAVSTRKMCEASNHWVSVLRAAHHILREKGE